MNFNDPWFLVMVGIIVIFVVLKSIQSYRARKLFNASFYTELYSGFFEYNLKRKNLKKLSVSNWLKQEIGEHRIFYQMAQGKKSDDPQAYILVILSSGVYTILCKNFIGEFIGKNAKFEVKTTNKDKKAGVITKNTRKVANPVAELKDFKHRWKSFVGKDFRMHDIVVFTDKCKIDVDDNLKDKIPFINRCELFNTIKAEHEANKEIMSDDEILSLYNSFMKKTNA